MLTINPVDKHFLQHIIVNTQIHACVVMCMTLHQNCLFLERHQTLDKNYAAHLYPQQVHQTVCRPRDNNEVHHKKIAVCIKRLSIFLQKILSYQLCNAISVDNIQNSVNQKYPNAYVCLSGTI